MYQPDHYFGMDSVHNWKPELGKGKVISSSVLPERKIMLDMV